MISHSDKLKANSDVSNYLLFRLIMMREKWINMFNLKIRLKLEIKVFSCIKHIKIGYGKLMKDFSCHLLPKRIGKLKSVTTDSFFNQLSRNKLCYATPSLAKTWLFDSSFSAIYSHWFSQPDNAILFSDRVKPHLWSIARDRRQISLLILGKFKIIN